MRPALNRSLASAIGVTVGLAAGLMVAYGYWVELAVLVVITTALGSGIRLFLPPATRSILLPLFALVFFTRAALAVLIHVGSLATPLGGFVSGDDREYYFLSRAFVMWLWGEAEPPFVPPYWAGRTYLFGTWVYVESGIFLLLGPKVLIPIFANAAFGTLVAVLIHDMTGRLFGSRPAFLAAVLVGFYPSLVLWSSLNLKEALTLLLISVVLWSILLLQRSGRLIPLLGLLIPLILLQTLRTYIFTGLALIAPVGVIVAVRLRGWERVRAVGATLAICASLLWANSAGLVLAPGLLTGAQQYRVGMAVGARTAIEGAAPVSVVQGSTFVIATASPVGTGPAASSATAEPPRVIHVPEHTRIVIGPRPASVDETLPRSTVYVREGDIVVVGGPNTTPAPPETRIRLTGEGQSRAIDLAPRPRTAADMTLRTIAYLPQGILYSLFAPWPWLSDRPLDLVAAPEMVLWYLALAATGATLWRERALWRTMAFPALYAAGLLVALALVEGNWGTLFRHRAMVIPFVLMLASPSFVWAWDGRGGFRRKLAGSLARYSAVRST